MTEHQRLGCLAVAAIGLILWLALPFASALLLGVLLAFTLEPLYDFLARRSGRPVLASLITVLLSAIGVVAAIAGFVSLFVARAVELALTVRSQLHSGGPLQIWVTTATRWLSHLGVSTSDLSSRLEAGAGAIASNFAALAGGLASGTFAVMLDLFFALLAMHLVLLHWPRMVNAMILVSPFRAEHSEALLQEFRRVGRITVFGTVATGLVQGFLATIGYYFCGVPEPIFFGIATAFASLIPAVGTMLVWVPAGLYLFATHHPNLAILELAWGSLMVIGFSDYVVRPRLVGDETTVALLVFIALFGGVEAFGLAGLIAGPVLMAIAVAALRLYAVEERQEPRVDQRLLSQQEELP